MQKLLVLLLLLLPCMATTAQKILKGAVLEAATGKAVAGASVFLSNTSKGTATDAQGQFTLYNFPEGKFDLVISCVGYETYVLTIESNNIPADFMVRLQQKTNELNEVVVGNTEKLSWKNWGKFFTDNFIGTSDLADGCSILNKEVIQLRRNKKTGTFTAFADEPLIIENKSLGYIIRYQLEQFESDGKTRVLFFAGYPLFENMPSDREKTKARWQKKREEAYYGSQLHFLRTVYRNKLAEENFEVRRLKKVQNQEKQRVKNVYRNYFVQKMSTKKTGVLRDPKDSSGYYDRILSEPDEKSYLDARLLTGDSIAYATDSTTLFLSFNDYLYVIYKNKKEPGKYLLQTRQQRSAANISSEMKLTEKEIQVFSNGSYYPGTAIFNSGFWGWWEKIGTMLPYDYNPSNQ